MQITQVGARIDDDRRDGTPLAVVWHVADGSLIGEDGWANDPRNGDGVAPHFMTSRFHPGEVHQYVQVARSARACGIRDGAVPADHGHAAWLLSQIGPVASPNRFTINIETEGHGGDRLDFDILANSVELGFFLWCNRGGACTEHDVSGDGHGVMVGIPCDRDHNLRHGEIGGHPLCPGYTEDELMLLIDGINAKLVGAPVAMPVPHTQLVSSSTTLETHGLDTAQTIAALNEINAHFTDVIFDSEGSSMLAVTKAEGVTIPDGKRAALVIY